MEEVALLQSASPVFVGFFLIIGKLTWEVGKRQGFAVDVPDALGLSSSSIFEECSKQYS